MTESDFPPVVEYIIAFLCVSDIIASSVVLVAVFSIKVFNSNFKLYLISMTINDIGIGLLALPKWVVLPLIGMTKSISWMFKGFTTASLFTSIGIAIDRYLAVAHPFTYRGNTPRYSAIAFIIFSWIYGLVNCSLDIISEEGGFNSSKIHMCSCTVLCFISFFAFVTSNVIIYWKLHRHERALQTLNRQIKREITLMRTIRMMFLVYFSLYCPYFIMQHLPTFLKDKIKDPAMIRKISGIPLVMSCVMNSIIYGYRVKVVKNQVKALCKCTARDEQLADVNSNFTSTTI